MKTKKFETYLPVFPGFYDTIFDCDSESNIIDSYNQENGTNLSYDDFNFDYVEYHNQIAQNCCKAIEKLLKDNNIINSIEFQKVYSPKFYNFENDSINIECDVNLVELKLFLTKYNDEFNLYIKQNYSSYDGFISHHSNDGDEWLKELFCNELSSESHKIGAILDFVCGVLIDDESHVWLYEQLEIYDYCEPNYTIVEQD